MLIATAALIVVSSLLATRAEAQRPNDRIGSRYKAGPRAERDRERDRGTWSGDRREHRRGKTHSNRPSGRNSRGRNSFQKASFDRYRGNGRSFQGRPNELSFARYRSGARSSTRGGARGQGPSRRGSASRGGRPGDGERGSRAQGASKRRRDLGRSVERGRGPDQMKRGKAGRGKTGPGRMSSGRAGAGKMGRGQMSRGKMSRGNRGPSSQGAHKRGSGKTGLGSDRIAKRGKPGDRRATQGSERSRARSGHGSARRPEAGQRSRRGSDRRGPDARFSRKRVNVLE